MHRRSPFPAVVFAVALVLTGVGAGSGLAQDPPAAATPPPAPAAPPPPSGEDGLFPAPDTTRPAPPPVTDAGELRGTGVGNRRGKRTSSRGGGRALGEGRQRGANPLLATAAADPVEVRIAYRRAETEAKRDPVFNELLRQADLAHDDEERRALLRRYYTDLFERVRRLNRSPALAAHVAVLSRAAELRYAPKRRVGGVDEQEASRARGGRR